ncbi:extracellular solute-binding protein [Rhizobium sp. CF142]|uniref:extracellular solute-binding protein n=1 Tax=Rhizobium sp. CF142 TaxID=1144314 RepID=UPI00026EEC18|nr:extracellular solute-binding protein [Rhizobium sp. CF142]EJJ26691.1 spermidine/putrescine-binding periplasmic protein [Rhizobium sp. CF142]
MKRNGKDLVLDRHGLTRRSFVGATATALISAPFVNQLVRPARAAGSGVVNFAGFGGSYGDALREVWFEPFEKETGIKVNIGVGASLALAKLQTVNPNGAEWDIVDLPNPAFITAVNENILLPVEGRIDFSKILPKYVTPYGWSYTAFVYVVGRNSKLIPNAAAPQTWADMWDTKRYSGKRSLNNVNTSAVSLEAALMADGVTPANIYPLDLDRAFASLDKLQKGNIVWGMSLQDPVQQIGSGQTPVGGIYTGRAIMANRQGAGIAYSLKQGIIGGDSLGVIRTSNNKDEAFTLLNFMATRGDLSAKFVERTSYGIPHVDVESLLPKDADDIRAALPTNPVLQETALFNNAQYYAEHMPEVLRRFQEWQLD